MHHIKEFNRFAHSYEEYKIIQKKVAKYLVENTEKKPEYILDVGAGSGEIYKNISWPFQKFYAIDASLRMLSLHPNRNVEKFICNFDQQECWQKLSQKKIDHIFSSSSLQWSTRLENVLKNIKDMEKSFSLAIFTSNTFKTLHSMLNISSPIYSKEEILNWAKKYFMVNYEIKEYKLFFDEKKEIFSYIKRSGVSSGTKRAKIGDLKRVLKGYPLKYLEFEVIFLWSKN